MPEVLVMALEALAPIAAAYLLGAYAPTRVGVAGLVVLLAALQIAFGIPKGEWVPYTLITVGPWLAGRAVRSRRLLVDALAERTRQLEAEEAAFARLAVQHERARIARELHDIVAHHLAVIVVQAGAGRLAARDPPERAALRLAGIGEAGRAALDEMARLVDLLQPEDEDPRERLRLVIERAEAAGLTVNASLLPLELPRELAETTHRIVQEGVTNALKHAPGAVLDVDLAITDDALDIDIRDRGGRAGSALADTGAGAGLAGLRERVAAADGQLDAGPAPGGGWRLHARLPLSDRRLTPAA